MMKNTASLVWMMMALVLAAACLLPLIVQVVHSKEIEATHEWQALGVNDTVAAGMHIRIDMTTGEKWVKIPDDNDNDASDSSSIQVMQISAIDGEPSLVVGADANGGTGGAGLYDYEMMFRALSKLPDEEKKRIGLPDDASDEEKLREIWTRRQEMLRDVVVADLPAILKDRIRGLKEFIAKPLAPLHEEEADSAILALVKDLEYLLQDIDMTRDFHTLGGWTELASLLSNTVIQQAIKAERRNGTEGVLDFNKVIDNIHLVQANAAWALGTAVKNTAEFAPYVLEYVSEPSTGTKMTVLEMVTFQIRDYAGGRGSLSAEEQTKMNKMVYCLWAFLSGNNVAQGRFTDYHGPAAVAKALIRASTDYAKDASNVKLVDRLVKIAADMAGTDPWKIPELCTAVGSVPLLSDRTAYLRGVQSYAASCPSWRDDTSIVRLNVRTVLESLSNDDEDFVVATTILQALNTNDQ
jgi:hypothetical protein